MALPAENVCRVSRRGFGEPCQAELLPRRMYLTGTRWMPRGDRAMRKMNQTTPKFWRPAPKLRTERVRCQGVMRVVSFMTEGRVIRRILDHLGASARRATQNRAPPPAPRPFRDPSEASPPCGRKSKFLSLSFILYPLSFILYPLSFFYPFLYP
jgi:hypothetical protein